MTSPVKNHNKGPIGPLDRDEPCPFDPNLRWYHRLTIADAYRALHSMGVELKDQEIERAIAEGTGPQHTMGFADIPKGEANPEGGCRNIFTVSAVP